MDDVLAWLSSRTIPPVPEEILNAFKEGEITWIPFEDRLRIFEDPSVRYENGVYANDDATFLVAASCFMPGVTKDMLEWWEWWFPQHPGMFRAWLPDTNIDFRYSEEDADFFEAPEKPPFRPHCLYPHQTIGDIAMPFKTMLVRPMDFGITKDVIAASGDPLVFCGTMGSRKGKMMYTDFIYAAFPVEGGAMFTSRFWMGRNNGNMLLRMLVMNHSRAENLGLSCYREYSSLSYILPELYERFNRA